MSRIIDDYNFAPTPIRQSGNSAFVLHEHYISSSGLNYSRVQQQRPMVIPKTIGRWSNSRYLWDFLLNVTFNGNIETLAHLCKIAAIKQAMEREASGDPELLKEIPALFRNVDLHKMLRDRCGFSSAIRRPNEFAALLSDVRDRRDPASASKLVASFMTLKAYTIALKAHDTGPSGGNSSGNLPIMPTLEQLDDYVADYGIGDPRWLGDMDFFGWDGDPNSLGAINPSQDYTTADAGMVASCKISPMAAHLAGFHGEKGSKEKQAVALLTVLDDGLQRNYREMNWHMPHDRFRGQPSASLEDRIETPLFSSRTHPSTDDSWSPGDAWIGSDPVMNYMRKEGAAMQVRMVGGIALANDFLAQAKAIGAQSGVYDPDVANLDQIWMASLAELASRQISTYGPTAAAIIEALQVGYMFMPGATSFDCSTDSERAEMETALLDGSPLFLLEPVYSTEAIQKVVNPGPQKDAFIELFQHTHLPHMSREQVAREVDRAVMRLCAMYERSVQKNWMDEVGQLTWSGEFEKVKRQLEHKDGSEIRFTEALDAFANDSVCDWEESLKKVKSTGSI